MFLTGNTPLYVHLMKEAPGEREYWQRNFIFPWLSYTRRVSMKNTSSPAMFRIKR